MQRIDPWEGGGGMHGLVSSGGGNDEQLTSLHLVLLQSPKVFT